MKNTFGKNLIELRISLYNSVQGRSLQDQLLHRILPKDLNLEFKEL